MLSSVGVCRTANARMQKCVRADSAKAHRYQRRALRGAWRGQFRCACCMRPRTSHTSHTWEAGNSEAVPHHLLPKPLLPAPHLPPLFPHCSHLGRGEQRVHVPPLVANLQDREPMLLFARGSRRAMVRYMTEWYTPSPHTADDQSKIKLGAEGG